MTLAFPSTEFDNAVADLCHGVATEEQTRALNELLRSNVSARDEYLIRVEIHARLASEPDLFCPVADGIADSQEPEIDSSLESKLIQTDLTSSKFAKNAKRVLALAASVALVAAGVWAGHFKRGGNELAEDWKPATSNQPGKQYPMVNAEGRVRVRISAPQATKVLLDIGAVKYPLTKGADGVWQGDSRPQDEGFHYYQLWIDGASVPDPGARSFYGASRWGSGIETPAKDQDFYAVKDVPHGQLREVYYPTRSKNTIGHALVYTPPDYDRNLNVRYPVLYLQHGAGEDENSWANQGRANLIMDNLIAAGKAKPFMIVIENGGSVGGGRGVPPGAVPNGSVNGAPVRGTGGFGGRGGLNFSAFEHALLDDVIPYIDSNFRTIADQPHRGMAGLSMGGMQTHSITLAHLDTFSQIGIFSGGSIGINEIADREAFKQQAKVVFFSAGSREGGAVMAKANAEALKQAGINSYYYESPLTGHEWQSWRRSLFQFAQLVFRN